MWSGEWHLCMYKGLVVQIMKSVSTRQAVKVESRPFFGGQQRQAFTSKAHVPANIGLSSHVLLWV